MNNTPLNRNGLLVYALAFSLVAAGAYLVYVLAYYGSLSGYLDHVEPNVSITGWKFLQGRPLYQESHMRDHSAIMYGPIVYFIQAGIFSLFGGSITIGKIPTVLFLSAGLLAFFFHIKSRYGTIYALAGALFFVAFCLAFAPYSIWNRPDPIIIALVTLSIIAKDISPKRLGRWTPHILVGICIGLSVNLKIHSFIYFLPIIVCLCGWTNFRQIAVIVGSSLAVFILPFTLSNVSFSNYLSGILEHAANRKISLTLFLSTLRYSPVYFSPGVLLAALFLRGQNYIKVEDTRYFFSLFCCIALLHYPASFSGAGAHHLLPLFPIVIDVMLRLAQKFLNMPRTEKAILVLFPLFLLVISLPVQKRLIRNLDKMAEKSVAVEIKEFTKRYATQTLEMGYGESFESYYFSFYRPVLVFAGQGITVDAQLLMDAQFDGTDLTPDFVADLRECRTRHWLIPKGERPFLLQSYYDGKRIFGKAPEVFLDNYEKSETLNYFDLWSCKN